MSIKTALTADQLKELLKANLQIFINTGKIDRKITITICFDYEVIAEHSETY